MATMIDTLEALKARGLSDKAEVVGKWIWIQFEAKPDVETRAALKDLGFHYNSKRGLWQNPCGIRSRHSNKGTAELLMQYGAYPVSETEEASHAA